MKKVIGIFIFIALSFSFLAIAQEPAATPIPVLDPATGWIDKLTGWLSAYWPMIAGLGAAELVGRLFKTKKPFGVIAGVSRLLIALGNFGLTIDSTIGKVIPQRTTASPPTS